MTAPTSLQPPAKANSSTLTSAQNVERENLNRYWSRNVRLIWISLLIWFSVSFGAAVFAQELNGISLLGFPLGYYMGAQGSIAVFVILITVYAIKMNKLDREFELHEEEEG